jgi:hypothetical protein
MERLHRPVDYGINCDIRRGIKGGRGEIIDANIIDASSAAVAVTAETSGDVVWSGSRQRGFPTLFLYGRSISTGSNVAGHEPRCIRSAGRCENNVCRQY